jgi:uncharacterized protein YjbJ (UPF0337 family)
MSERIDETKGKIKEGIGKLKGDPELEAEGRVEHDTAKAKREAKGVGHKVKGKIEEGVGELTGDEETQARGIADRLKGESERAG